MIRSLTHSKPFLAALTLVMGLSWLRPPGTAYAQEGSSADPLPEWIGEVNSYLEGVEKITAALPATDVESASKGIGAKPEHAFAWVRDHVAAEPYPGLLRGANQTIASQAGNSFDQAVALAGLLEKRSVTVRFAVGSLPKGLAQKLPGEAKKQSAVVGRERALATQRLLALADKFFPDDELQASRREGTKRLVANADRDVAEIRAALAKAKLAPKPEADPWLDLGAHCWLQIKQGNAWLDLDPYLPWAEFGKRYGVLKSTSKQIPDAHLHQVEVALRLARGTGGKTDSETMLKVSVPTSVAATHPFQLVLLPADLAKWNLDKARGREGLKARLEKATSFQAVLVAGGKKHGSHPFDLTGNRLEKKGNKLAVAKAMDKITDMFGRAMRGGGTKKRKFGGLWLEITSKRPGQSSRHYARRLVGDLQVSRNKSGWKVHIHSHRKPEEIRAELLVSTRLAVHVAPQNGFSVLRRHTNAILSRAPLIKQSVRAWAGRKTERQGVAKALEKIASFVDEVDALLENSYGYSSQASPLVLREPALVLLHTRTSVGKEGLGSVTRAVDILQLPASFIASKDSFGLRLKHGVLATHLEDPQGIGVSVPRLIQAARTEKIPLTLVSKSTLQFLDKQAVGAEAHARISAQVGEGFVALAPAKRTSQGIGWWRIDPKTGECLGFLESGHGGAFVEYVVMVNEALFMWSLNLTVLKHVVRSRGDDEAFIQGLSQELLSDPFFILGAIFGALAIVGRLARAFKALRSMCFLKGTLVPTPRGLIKIEALKIGDQVLSRDPATGRQGYKRVTLVYHGVTKQVCRITLTPRSRVGRTAKHSVGKARAGSEDPVAIACTPGHRLFSARRGDWVTATDLRPGDLLLQASGEVKEVKRVELVEAIARTWNLEVEDWHTYFVSGDQVWVHNKTCKKLIDHAKKGTGPFKGKWEKPPGWRLPRKGKWIGKRGHGLYRPPNPSKYGLKPGEYVPFKNGVPDFSKWSKGNYKIKGLKGNHEFDMPHIHKELAKRWNKSKFDGRRTWNQTQVKNWLSKKNLTPHHYKGQQVQLVPGDVHSIRHTGSAKVMRDGG